MIKSEESTVDSEADMAFSIQVTGGANQQQQAMGRKLTLVCEGEGQRGFLLQVFWKASCSRIISRFTPCLALRQAFVHRFF